MEALQAGEHRNEKFAEMLVNDLDAGEGWTDHHDDAWWWYPGTLAVQVRYSLDGNRDGGVDVNIRVVRGAELTIDLAQWLNDSNAHALGWWWWFEQDTGDVYCSMRTTTDAQTWWWPMITTLALPHAVTVAESMARIIADAGNGQVALESHPSRGPRAEVDGWILGTQLGPRDMAASLDPWLAPNELSRLALYLEALGSGQSGEVREPLTVVVSSSDGEPRVTLRRHWHASWGWGWQLALLTGIKTTGTAPTSDGKALALFLNQEQALTHQVKNQFGGWIYDQDAGVLHLTFLPGLIVDQLISAAGPTIGDVAALMMELPTKAAMLYALPVEQLSPSLSLQPVDEGIGELLRTLTFRVGPIGWSYELGAYPEITETSNDVGVAWSAEQPDGAWNIPKHLPVCSFGIFNPMGPTVSSLEIGMRGTRSGIEFSLFYVMRHPHSPEIRLIGTSNDLDDIDTLIFNCLADHDPETSVLGSGPEWIEIFAHPDSVLAGLRAFAAADEEADWRATADDLVNYALAPWGRVSAREPSTDSTFDAGADPIDCWLSAVTDYVVLVGQKLFMRSAWEGALAYRRSDWDADEAQRAADRAREGAQERLDADFGSRR